MEFNALRRCPEKDGVVRPDHADTSMREYAISIAIVLLFVIGTIVFLSCRRRADDRTQGRARGTTPDGIQRAIQKLLDATPRGEKGGFVIFGGYRTLDYVQFALDPNGLLLNWPTMQKDGPERLPKFREQLESRGFQSIAFTDAGPPVSEQIGALQRANS